MKILVIDYPGSALDWSMQCQNAGHDVKLWIGPTKEHTRNPTGDGIVPRVPDFRKYMDWADLIWMSDNAYCQEMIEPFHKMGYPIFGPPIAGGELELDRQRGQDLFKRVGMSTMGGHEFDDYSKAIEFVRKNPKIWVSKPDGDVDKALSFVSKNPAEMEYMLMRWKKDNPGVRGFILQEFCPGLGEMAVGGWFGKNGWLEGWVENFEFKRLMAGDAGPNTGETGTLIKYVKESKLAEELLIPLTDHLKKIKYRGYFDMASIIDKKGVARPLEATARPGWPCDTITKTLHRGDPAQWMVDALEGRDTLQWVNEIACGVVVATGHYPFGDLTKKDLIGYPITVPEDELTRGIHLSEVMMGEAPHMVDDEVDYGETFVSAGDYIAVATGNDYSVAGAAKQAYRMVKKVELTGTKIFRNDIGKRLEDQIPELQEHGYATDGWDYE